MSQNLHVLVQILRDRTQYSMGFRAGLSPPTNSSREK